MWCLCSHDGLLVAHHNLRQCTYIPSALEREQVFCYVNTISGNCWRPKGLKTWPPVLRQHVPEPLCAQHLQCLHVHKSPSGVWFGDLFLMLATGNHCRVDNHLEDNALDVCAVFLAKNQQGLHARSWVHRQRYLSSVYVGCNCLLQEMSVHVTYVVTSRKPYRFLPADYDVSIETSQVCDNKCCQATHFAI